MLGRMPGKLVRRSSLGALLLATTMAGAGPAGAVTTTPSAYSRAVTQICAHALLFEERHAIGTRQGALEVAGDIRASSQRRLARAAAVPAPSGEEKRVVRWLALEQRLAEAYAVNYLRIYDLIAEPRTPKQKQDTRVARLARLMHAPDQLRRAAARLELRLRVPDCTGG
jgi:hypothetical protein